MQLNSTNLQDPLSLRVNPDMPVRSLTISGFSKMFIFSILNLPLDEVTCQDGWEIKAYSKTVCWKHMLWGTISSILPISNIRHVLPSSEIHWRPLKVREPRQGLDQGERGEQRGEEFSEASWTSSLRGKKKNTTPRFRAVFGDREAVLRSEKKTVDRGGILLFCCWGPQPPTHDTRRRRGEGREAGGGGERGPGLHYYYTHTHIHTDFLYHGGVWGQQQWTTTVV